jgi:hypothetical protein
MNYWEPYKGIKKWGGGVFVQFGTFFKYYIHDHKIKIKILI